MVFDCRTTNIIRIFDEAGNVIDTHENRRELKSELFFGRTGQRFIGSISGFANITPKIFRLGL